MSAGPVLKYPGSKWRISEWIVRHLPPHDTYLEPFFGSGAVFFRKEPSLMETINDLDGDVVNLFRVLRDQDSRVALMEAVALTPYARAEHAECWEMPRVGDPVEDARRFLVRIWMNHGMRIRRKGGWSHATGRRDKYGAIGGVAARHLQWAGLPDRIAAAAARLKNTLIEGRPALDVISRHAHSRCLIYADPPYVLATRSEAQYVHEMTLGDHEELLRALALHPGPVLLSGYDHPLYSELLADWFDAKRMAYAEKGGARTEVLWINPVAQERLGGRLF